MDSLSHTHCSLRDFLRTISLRPIFVLLQFYPVTSAQETFDPRLMTIRPQPNSIRPICHRILYSVKMKVNPACIWLLVTRICLCCQLSLSYQCSRTSIGTELEASRPVCTRRTLARQNIHHRQCHCWQDKLDI